MLLKRTLWLVMMTVFSITIVSAQDSCQLIQPALDAVADRCADLDPNQVCYGNDQLIALGFDGEPLTTLSDVGDTSDVFEVASIATSPFNSDTETWGVALMSLQAVLPDTVAGQSVTFVVFGDTELSNQVIPEDMIVTSLAATSTGNINIRSGAGTNFARVGTLAAGEEVMLTGRNAAADWVQIETENTRAWVYAPLVTTEGDLSLLAVMGGEETDTAYTAPMQAFRLQTGVGQSTCSEVPPDGVLIQAPQNTTVQFLVNGVEVQVGSTVFIQIVGGRIVITTLDGTVTVTSAGISQVIEPGYTVYVTVGSAPGTPIEFAYDDFSSLPLLLLPDPIGIPVLVRSNNVWRDTGIAVSAGDTFDLQTGGLINFWDFCETQKVANGQPDIDCDSLVFGPEGGDPVTITGAVLGSDMSLFPVPSAPPHSLVMRIGSSTFYVGNGGSFTATESGTLEFRANDVDLNNIGAFFVSVILP